MLLHMFNKAQSHGSYFLQVVYPVQSTLDNTMILPWHAFNSINSTVSNSTVKWNT